MRVWRGRGFAWVLNRLRVSDLDLSLEGKFALGQRLLRAFRREHHVALALLRRLEGPREARANRTGFDPSPLIVAFILQFCDLPL